MSTAARKTIFGLILAASLIFGVTSAQAANLVPNPGFEDECSGVPCQWQAQSGTIARDTTPGTALSGSASLAIMADGANVDLRAVSGCFAISPAPVEYYGGVWYRTTNPSVHVVEFTEGSTDATCTDFTPVVAMGTTSPVTTGAWTLLRSGPVAIGPSPLPPWRIRVGFSCSPAPPCAEGTTVNFDDAAMQTEPLAVTFASASATRTTKGVLLRWRTGTEADLAGFHVYRSRGHSWQRVTRSLIAAKGSVSGASYRFLDRTARRSVSYQYRIRALNRDGTAAWFGPVHVT